MALQNDLWVVSIQNYVFIWNNPFQYFLHYIFVLSLVSFVLPFQYAYLILLFLEFTLPSKSMHTRTFENMVTGYDMQQQHIHELYILPLKRLDTVWSCCVAGEWCGNTVQIWNILLHTGTREGGQGVIGATAEAVEQEDCYWDPSCQEVLQGRGVPSTVPWEGWPIWFQAICF